MRKYELSKDDFDLIDRAFLICKVNTKTFAGSIEAIQQLRDKFALAHTAWLEIEEQETP